MHVGESVVFPPMPTMAAVALIPGNPIRDVIEDTP